MSADERTLGERVEDVIERLFVVGDAEAATLLREQQARIADLEAARVDAERYRHIKAEWAIVRDFFPNRWHISTPYIYGDSFDAAIDLARARGEGNADE